MSSRIAQRLAERYEHLTVSERMIAGWLADNLDQLPFETAASIGNRVGVSAMTVARLVKSLGYDNLAALKDDLRDDARDAPWLLTRPAPSADARLKAETAAIAGVYRLAETPEWAAIVALLAAAPRVHVAGFQTEAGLAAGFARHLSYVRPQVQALDMAAGIMDVLVDAGPQDVFVAIDVRRYSRQFRLLAERVAASGRPLVVITDPYCPWARDLTPHILTAEVALGHFWDMNSALASLLNLLVDGVVQKIGPDQVHERLAVLAEHYADFIGFQGRVKSASPPADRS
ncbi:MurR/RpiR family transcriptional regulator [Sandarakinorhabdus sp.]|jgi:DNA-binding MurR/RpiR family transcriptional regulator|uniref:MurR/RpiR family transcriptional regulator n=1 Tax=Sandarakinorhabdus sp. TaxID=1916663 RepID=UPI0028ACE05D|nr:MurR/RpiR family transcriptional regulator [Sandarakinorhabdus sp.]